MTQENPATNPPSDPSDAKSESTRPPGLSEQPKPVKRKWLRKVGIGIGVVILLLLLLVALLPTLLSTGAARSFAIGKINENLNGKVAIAEWSVSWTGGIRAEGVKVFDEAGRQILEIPHFSTQLNLIDAAKGNIHLGKTVVDGLDFFAERAPDGTLNFSKLAKTSQSTKQSTSTSAESKPSKLPSIDGDLELKNCRGTFQDDQKNQSVHLTAIDGVVKIPGINESITDTLKVVANVDHGQSGTITVDGKLRIAKDQLILDPDKMDVEQSLGISGFELASLAPMLPASAGVQTLAGAADGSFAIKIVSGQTGSVGGSLRIARVKVGGKALKGDTFVADEVSVNIPPTTVDLSAGMKSIDGSRIRIGTAGGNEAISVAIANNSSGQPSKSTLTVTMDATLGLLANVASSKSPGTTGSMHASVHVDVATLASVPHLLSLQPNTKLDTGIVDENLDIQFTDKNVDLGESLLIHDVTATNTAEQRKIILHPITLTLKANDAGGGGKLPDIRDINLSLHAGQGDNEYAGAEVHGSSLSTITISMNAVLSRFQKELGQLVDFQGLNFRDGSIGIAGTINYGANQSAADLNINASNLVLEKASGSTIERVLDKYSLAAAVNATYAAGADESTKVVVEKLKVNDADSNGQSMIGIQLADNKPVHLNAMPGGKMQGDGVIQLVRLDLAKLMNLAQSFGPPVAPHSPPQARLTSGDVAGTIGFSTTEKEELKADVDLGISHLTYVVPDAKGLVNEELKLVISALAMQNFASATVQKFDLASSVATVHIPAAEIRLKEGTTANAPSTPVLAMARNAIVVIDVPSLAKLQDWLDAFSATHPSTKPLEKSASASTDRYGALYAVAKHPEAKATDPAASSPPTKLAGGSATISVNLSSDNGQMVIAPVVDAKDVALSKDGVNDPIGAMKVRGKIHVIAAPQRAADVKTVSLRSPPATAPSLIDQIAGIRLDGLSVSVAESGITINGTLDDVMHARIFKDFMIDLEYDGPALWKVVLPLLSKDQQTKLKDAKVEGKYTKRISVAGSFPADAEFNHAISFLKASGEIQLDLFTGEGITMRSFILPFAVADGKAKIAYANKPAGQDAPAPTDLNGGKLNLAGVVVDLADPHMLISMPTGTKLLDSVDLNAALASNIGDYINNPLFIGADEAAGKLNITVNTCDRLPTDDTLTLPVASNAGVLDLTMTVSRIQLGNPTLKKIVDALNSAKILGSVSTDSLQGELDPLHVHIEHGITTEEMTLHTGQKKRPLLLNGTVEMKSRMVNMTLDLPYDSLGIKAPSALSDGIKLPITGPANHPKFDLGKAFQQNLKVNPKDLLKEKPKDLLNDLLGKKKKDKPSDSPDGEQ